MQRCIGRWPLLILELISAADYGIDIHGERSHDRQSSTNWPRHNRLPRLISPCHFQEMTIPCPDKVNQRDFDRFRRRRKVQNPHPLRRNLGYNRDVPRAISGIVRSLRQIVSDERCPQADRIARLTLLGLRLNPESRERCRQLRQA